MEAQGRIKDAWDRMVGVLTRRPAAAQGTSVTTVRLASGLRCTVEEGVWRLTADQPAELGGDNSAPDPGFLGRGALGVCAAQCYAMALARHGVPHRGIEVRVEGDYDAAGLFLQAHDVPIGYGAVRCIVTVDSDAAEPAILAALDDADRRSPWRYNFTRALPVARHVTLRRHASGGGADAA